MENRLKDIKKHAAIEVAKRREDLKRMLAKMKQKAQRKTNSLHVKLQTVKNTMAQDLNKAYKKGTSDTCKTIGNGEEVANDKSRVESRKNYCTASFAEDYTSYQNCLDTDDFCHLCCDNEFGEFYLNEREQCYQVSCNAEPIHIDTKEDASGRWIWQTTETAS